jgi:hypothetical protein
MDIIPVDQSLLFWQQTTAMDGVSYLLEFRYNTREALYYLKIMMTDSTVLAQGIKLVSNYPLLQGYNDDRMPLGEIIAVAPSSDDSPAALGEIGGRVTLVYYTEAEIQAVGLDPWRNPLP